MSGDEVLCADCARTYWLPFDYKEFQYEKNPKQSGASGLSVPAPAPAAEPAMEAAPAEELYQPQVDPEAERTAALSDMVTQTQNNLAAYDANGDRTGAIDYLSSQLELMELNYGERDASLDLILSDYCASYKQQVLSDAMAAFTDGGYSAALHVLDVGYLRLSPEDPELVAAAEYYSQFAPVYISDLEYFTSEDDGFRIKQSDVVDNLGNLHSKCIYKVPDSNGNYTSATYYIDGKYTTFTGTVFLDQDDRDSPMRSVFRVYGDDILLFESQPVTSGHMPEPFSLNVKGVAMLRLEMQYLSGYKQYYVCSVNVGEALLS